MDYTINFKIFLQRLHRVLLRGQTIIVIDTVVNNSQIHLAPCHGPQDVIGDPVYPFDSDSDSPVYGLDHTVPILKGGGEETSLRHVREESRGAKVPVTQYLKVVEDEL